MIIRGSNGSIVDLVQKLMKEDPDAFRFALEEIFYTNPELFEKACPQILDGQTHLIQKLQFEKFFLPLAISNAERDDSPMSLIMFDLDNFGDFNKDYGHLMGDKVIANFSNLLRKSFRSRERRPYLDLDIRNMRMSDRRKRFSHYDVLSLVARVGGGEEFSVIMPRCEEENAYNAAERALKLTHEMTIPFGNELLRFTASAGVAQYEKGNTPEEFIDRVDKSLYHSKKTGKNRATKYSDFISSTAPK